MGFDPNASKFTMVQRFKPVVLLLDVSGSMSGEKIDRLYDAVTTMIDRFQDGCQKEISYKVAIITFGAGGASLHTPYTDVGNLQNLPRFQADGGTPLGRALMMAKEMIEDPDTTKRGAWYRPTVVLVSDGYPNDSWEQPMRDFIQGTGRDPEKKDRSTKCQRMAVGIGSASELDERMLQGFVSEPDFYFHAENASEIAEKFDLLTTKTMNTAKQSAPEPKFTARTQVGAQGNPMDAGGFRRTTSRRGTTTARTAATAAAAEDDDLYN